jgi:hypothetical protein
VPKTVGFWGALALLGLVGVVFLPPGAAHFVSLVLLVVGSGLAVGAAVGAARAARRQTAGAAGPPTEGGPDA